MGPKVYGSRLSMYSLDRHRKNSSFDVGGANNRIGYTAIGGRLPSRQSMNHSLRLVDCCMLPAEKGRPDVRDLMRRIKPLGSCTFCTPAAKISLPAERDCFAWPLADLRLRYGCGLSSNVSCSSVSEYRLLWVYEVVASSYCASPKRCRSSTLNARGLAYGIVMYDVQKWKL